MIELQDISKTYRMGQVEVNALAGVSFHIAKGEVVTIMGPSGSGKSTLMNIMGCLDTPSSGRYILDGKEVSGLSERELAWVRNHKIGFVFQQFNLLPRTSALENVGMPLRYGNVGQWRQRSLVNQPAIVLADEPTGNLDSRTSMEILDLLLRLNHEEGITIILVTHDPGIGARTQRIITLRDGLLSEDSQRVTDDKR